MDAAKPLRPQLHGQPGQAAVPASPSYLVELADQFRASRDPYLVFEKRTAFVDVLVKQAVLSTLESSTDRKFVVAAVGGYGRKELFPYSDVDILLLFENESDLEQVKAPLSEFLRSLWDLGLRVSHSVHALPDCSQLQEQNSEFHISLLDLRFLSGSEELFASLQRGLPDFYGRYAEVLAQRIAALARHRHAKFNNTVYHLEPSIKECPGGIRDIHLLRWLAQLNPQHEPLREAFDDLAGARQFLFALRCFLHFQAKRDNNLLTFESQDEVSRVLPEEPLDPAQWMRIYFQHARHVYNLSLRALEHAESHDSTLLRHFRDWRSRLSTSDFTISRDRVFLRNPALTVSSAASVLDLFTFIARHGIHLAWDAQRRIRSAQEEIAGSFSKDPLPWSVWREFFSQPYASLSLSEMQATGLLAGAIPHWSQIDSLVVRDFYHRYTVDEHTLVAIGVIDNLFTEKPDIPARYRELLKEVADSSVLRLALLMHDIGKGTLPGEHVLGSVQAAETIMNRLEVPAEIRPELIFLIEHHVDLSMIMNSRDLDDPATARYLTARINTHDRLRLLTLLTYADISAVNPTAMTPWRVEQLWRVYTIGAEQLTRELVTDRIHVEPATIPGEALTPELSAFLEGLPMRYIRTHRREEMEHHAKLALFSGRSGVAVEVTKDAGAYLMTSLSRDRAGLFSVACGALASFGMNIVKAEAFGNAQGTALQLMRFSDPMRTLELNPSETDRLTWTVERAILGAVDVSELLKGRRSASRPSRGARIQPFVRFNNDASDTSTLIDFTGEDRPGLLYDLTFVLNSAGCNIEVVMIDTEAHKAIDVFYVTKEQAKLDEAMRDELEKDLLRVATRA